MKRDNGSYGAKVEVRRTAIGDVSAAKVLECFAGSGAMYRAVYEGAKFGACMDLDQEKAEAASIERPMWACYAGDTTRALRSGWMGHVPFDVVDVDAYGSPWETVLAWLTSKRERADVTRLIITDGVYAKIRMSGLPKCLLIDPNEERKNGWTPETYSERVRSKVGAACDDAGLQILDWTIARPNKVRGRPNAIRMAQNVVILARRGKNQTAGIS